MNRTLNKEIVFKKSYEILIIKMSLPSSSARSYPQKKNLQRKLISQTRISSVKINQASRMSINNNSPWQCGTI